MEDADKIDIHVEAIAEALPYLVKGFSNLTNSTVVGFPYVHMAKKEDGMVEYCNCIISLNYDDGKQLDVDGYDFALKHGEFHPISGPMHKFVCIEDGVAMFEDDIEHD